MEWQTIDQFKYEGPLPDGNERGYLVVYADGMEPDGGFRQQIVNGLWLSLRKPWEGITHFQPMPDFPK